MSILATRYNKSLFENRAFCADTAGEKLPLSGVLTDKAAAEQKAACKKLAT